MRKIGVEDGLTNVQEALQERGYEVVPIHNEADVQDLDCCIVSGLDSNVMGMQTISIEGPVIEASGLSAEEICQEVENRLH